MLPDFAFVKGSFWKEKNSKTSYNKIAYEWKEGYCDC